MPAPSPAVPDHLVQFAHRWRTRRARWFHRSSAGPISIELKADESPVTAADRAAEEAITALIRAEYPAHGILGEEQGCRARGAAGRGRRGRCASGCGWWTPSTARRVSSRGKPLFGTLIALLHGGRPVLGVLEQPVLRERWVGVHGRPTTFNGLPVATRRCAALRDAYVYTTSPTSSPAPAARRSAR
ncbi:hypothetical protein CLOM_g14011 [Closterium sp. NIES-68]|nr:hypothetical protein CLOM_g14011 [Closterium sp. NIES-68]